MSRLEERVARVAAILRSYPGISAVPDEKVRKGADSIVHYGTERFTEHWDEEENQLAALAALIKPLREFLEDKRSLNRNALSKLDATGFLDRNDGRDVDDVVELLKKAEIRPPPGRGRPKAKYKSDNLAWVVFQTVGRLTGDSVPCTYSDKEGRWTGPFPYMLGELFKELLLEPNRNLASVDGAMKYVSGRNTRRQVPKSSGE